MTTISEIEDALAMSTDTLRMAEQMLRLNGAGAVADLLRDRAEKNMQVSQIRVHQEDLKSFSRQRECGFESRPGHHHCKRTCRFLAIPLLLLNSLRRARKYAPSGKMVIHLDAASLMFVHDVVAVED